MWPALLFAAKAAPRRLRVMHTPPRKRCGFSKRILDALAPLRCRLCEQPSDTGLSLCALCRSQLLRNRPACRHCALPLPLPFSASEADLDRERLCPECQRNPGAIACTVAPFIYEAGIGFLIHRWKYHGESRLAPTLGRLWLDAARPEIERTQIDIIAPVPLHWRRFVQRGFNQSADLAAVLARALDLPLDRRLLRRPRATPPQARAGRLQRQRVLEDSFSLVTPPQGARVAVIDDVCTTGATAAAVAATLRAGGVREVQLWCLARTPDQRWPGRPPGRNQYE
jgi:ComF family protein